MMATAELFPGIFAARLVIGTDPRRVEAVKGVHPSSESCLRAHKRPDQADLRFRATLLISPLGKLFALSPQTSLELKDLLRGVDAPHRSVGAHRNLSQRPLNLIPALSLRIVSEDFLSRVDPPDHAIVGHRNLSQLTGDLIPTWS